MVDPSRLLYNLYKVLWASLDLIFPPECVGCGEPGSQWCKKCQASVVRLPPPICDRCGESQNRPGLCRNCQDNPSPPVIIRSWVFFEGSIRNAIHQLKYSRNLSLGLVLADSLTVFLDELGWNFDLVIPVPLGVARLQERGYNQAALLALPIALKTSAAYTPRGLVKVRDTPTQVGLDRRQRRENVKDAFVAEPAVVSNRRALVVDDVATSNATLEACAEALLAGGAEKVYCITVARAGLHSIGGIP